MTKRILTLLALAMAAPVMADTVPLSAIERCAALSEDGARLKCYDQIAQAHNLSLPASDKTRSADTGKWTLDKKVDPIDDTKTVHIYLTADSGNSRFGKPIMLMAQCDSEKTELLIDWQIYLGSIASVTLRIGDNEARTSRWTISSDKQKSFNKNPIDTLKEMLTAEQMVAQITPFNQSPSTAVFDISGLAEAIKPLREACDW